MKASRNTDHALREALSRLAQRQPTPPEGMTERFMARLAQEQADNTAGKETRRHALPISRRLWLPAAAAAATIIGFILWTNTTKTEKRQPVMAEAQHPTEHITPSLCPQPAATAPISSHDTEKPNSRPTSPPAARHKPAARTLTACTAPAPCSTSEESPIVSEKPEQPSATASNASQPVTETRQLVTETHSPDAATPEKKPSSTARPEIVFTAAEIELDRQAIQADRRYGHLIAGEEIALARISLREHLSALSTVSKKHSTNHVKPIAI